MQKTNKKASNSKNFICQFKKLHLLLMHNLFFKDILFTYSFPTTILLELFKFFFVVFFAEKNGCPKQFNQTAYKTAKTTIRCDHPENKTELWFFCKEKSSVCNNILSDRISFHTNTYSVSISNVSSEDKGAYWCGVKFTENNHHVALTKVKLKVEGE